MNYQLHDSIFDKFDADDGKITIHFSKGFYCQDENNNELAPKKLIITYEDDFFILMSKNYKPYKEITLKKFIKLLSKEGSFIIDDEYDSKYDNRKIIMLNSIKSRMSFRVWIFDITGVACV